LFVAGLPVFLASQSFGFVAPTNSELPNLDQRPFAFASAVMTEEQATALAGLQANLPGAAVDLDPISGAPKLVIRPDGFLTAPDGQGVAAASLNAALPADPDRVAKTFLDSQRELFGHGSDALATANVVRDYITAHNGLHTKVWQQQLDGVGVFEAVLIAHTTSQGELVNIGSQFLSDLAAAADRGTPNRASVLAAPPISAPQALLLAATNAGAVIQLDTLKPTGEAVAEPELKQKFTARGLKGEAETKLVWLPMDRQTLRLCWDVVLMGRARGEMFRLLLDAQTGKLLIRHSLTAYLTDATYRVFTSDSPTPLSPGYPTPVTNQPPLVSRTLVTLSAMDTNASPSGWINDGGNETLGNNVDAHTDLNSDNVPDLPRPQGSPPRTFDFPMDLTTQDPSNYSAAAVVQLFYLCNFMHDQLYGLGFTEAAGNFQTTNFNRGGQGNDAVQADAQDGGNFNNANFSTPTDGSPGRMQMYIWNGPTPRRDGDLDAEMVCHEYTHGLSNRRVGGGVGLSASQSMGMGEGWSDFYALSLLSQAGDDVNGNYAASAYVALQFSKPTNRFNYYFGVRRYPYTTDMSRNPLTFRDIDPAQIHYCSSPAPFNTAQFGTCSGTASSASEVHSQGEVWCSALWQARANLIARYGWAVGNHLILQLVTDGMGLSPVNPNFLQARNAILQADLVDTGGANTNALWAAFAKRGMGKSATSPGAGITSGVQEAYDFPDDLVVTPTNGINFSGPVGGPFSPASQVSSITNVGTNTLTWTMSNTSPWLNVSPSGGTLPPASPATPVTVSLTTNANNLGIGVYTATVWFTNLTTMVVGSRTFMLQVGKLDYFTALNPATSNLAFTSFYYTLTGDTNYYSVCRSPAVSLPSDPTGGTVLAEGDDDSIAVTLSGTNTISLYGRRTNVFYVGSNGYITLNSGDRSFAESYAAHFNRPRISALFHDLVPAADAISWKQFPDRVAVTYQAVPASDNPGPNTLQVEMFADGRLRITYLDVNVPSCLTGLSAGTGVPTYFTASDFSKYPTCPPPAPFFVPPSLISNGQFQFTLSGMIGSNYDILVSSNLQTWSKLATVTLTNTSGTFLDTNTGLQQRFYKARSAP
jgi:hypothetical protein